MKEHLRFSVGYWHTFRGMGCRPIRPGHGRSAVGKWKRLGRNRHQNRVRVAFEFIEKLGVPFYCFHDRDVAPEGTNLAETNANLDEVVPGAQGRAAAHRNQAPLGHREPLQQPAFHARRGDQPATPTSLPIAAAQVKKALEITQELGGDDYVFWGGREGYQLCSTPT